MLTQSRILWWSLPGCLILALGCGGSSGPKLCRVSGRVTVEGDKPFSAGTVRFIPAPGSNLNSREAITDSQGRYRMEFFPGQPGLQPGDYKVMFSLYQMPDGSPVPDQSKEVDPQHPTQLGAVQMVSPEFEFGKADVCAVTITEGGGEFDFDLPELKPQPVDVGSKRSPRRR